TDPPPTSTTPLSLHDALPIFATRGTKLAIKINDNVIPATIQLADEVLDLCRLNVAGLAAPSIVIDSVTSLRTGQRVYAIGAPARSEEHTSELQSRSDLVCRLL